MSQPKKNKVYVVGVGMTKFVKPGSGLDYPEMAREAGTLALKDAGLSYEQIEQAVVGYCYGPSTCGQRAIYELGLTGIPVINVNNNCSTGSSALYIAKQYIAGGIANCVMALGFEKMERGSLSTNSNDRTNPLDKHAQVLLNTRSLNPKAPFAPQLFASAGLEHMEKYKTNKIHFAKIAEKNHRHSANNPYSQFRDVYTLEQICQSPVIAEPLTKLQCCPTSDGAACAILCSEDFVKKFGLEHQAVEILGIGMATDMPGSFKDSCINMVGYQLSQKAASIAYKEAGINPDQVQVVELHDCFSANELVTYEALGLCQEGKAGEFVDSGNNTYGGKYVVNPSGGLISKGHPLGATGLAQCSELCWQLRQMCGKRQVPNAKLALQHNLGLGGAAVVAVYGLGFPEKFQPFPESRPNPAVQELTNQVVAKL
eukprot:TRINITY_DN7023_c0_g1_i1.p1 TRINITY_DN7023_c0_g1~~TRINITY_DN7023_c0_g1_i1.p1  ORF type:complete len:427 (+),score=79.83 TRINITY_DN7023_c0_g1_i1:91-1371(+)